MTKQDYYIAYKFLKIRTTESGQIAPFRVTDHLEEKQARRIHEFLRRVHQVKMI